MRIIVKKVINAVDDISEINLYRKIVTIRECWYRSEYVNKVRRILSPLAFKLRYSLISKKQLCNLHLGCGGRKISGYVNIDFRKTGVTDIVCDISKLPFSDHSVRKIETYHAIEHLSKNNFKRALNEWFRILIPGGKLIIECPDFDAIAKKYLDGDEKQIDGIFGHQRFEGDYHLFGYNIKRLSKLLFESGFDSVKSKPPQDYHAKEWSCLRIECEKKNQANSFASISCKQAKHMPFTGERVVENETPKRIWLDHVARYVFALDYVKDKIVLDIACGTGFGSNILYQGRVGSILSMEISLEALDFARIKYNTDGRINFIAGDITDICLKDNTLDLIVCFETIEHIKNDEKAISELWRVLKPEGMILISSPNRILTSPGKSLNNQPNNQFHIAEYSKPEFIQKLSNSFHINEVYGQRPLNKFFLIPLIESLFRRYFPRLYHPGFGNHLVKKCKYTFEYRYFIAICTKKKKTSV